MKLLFLVIKIDFIKQGCYACGFYLEGARWSVEKNCLSRSLPKRLVEPLPIMSIIPIEAHRLLLQVSLTHFFYKSIESKIVNELLEHLSCPGIHDITAT